MPLLMSLRNNFIKLWKCHSMLVFLVFSVFKNIKKEHQILTEIFFKTTFFANCKLTYIFLVCWNRDGRPTTFKDFKKYIFILRNCTKLKAKQTFFMWDSCMINCIGWTVIGWSSNPIFKILYFFIVLSKLYTHFAVKISCIFSIFVIL